MKILGFIPARGGSKGIPGKNLVCLRGKPLLQYTIEAAQACGLIDEIFLSSDDERVIEAGKRCGLNCIYRRPALISGDRALVIDAVLDGLAWLEERGATFDAVALLQPTSPLRTAADIEGAIRMFMQSDADSLVGVHRMTEHPYECVRQSDSDWRWLEKPFGTVAGRQDYDQRFWFINGAIYIAKTDFLRRERLFVEEGRSLLYPMEQSNGLDIDDLSQLALAEFWLSRTDAV